MGWFRRRRPAAPDPVEKNVNSLARLEQELANRRTPLDRVSDAISRFTGSIQFIIAHVLFFAVWMGANTALLLGQNAFDPYPFVFLNLVLAVEAVLLGTFVLMSQNRQNRQADLWLRIVLQLGLLSEQETTKTLQLLRCICDKLDIKDAARDKELGALIATTHLDALAEQLRKSRADGDAAVSGGGGREGG
jgi:uncharacterized membrane protein